MKQMKEMLDDQVKISEELEILNKKTEKQKQCLDLISTQISGLKIQEDNGSLKFIHANLNTIIEKLAPKHKLPKAREIKLSTSSDNHILASIPYGSGECSDNNPCNINYCDRCTLLHADIVLGRILANYYSNW